MNEESLFHLALQQPQAARSAFVEQACANQPELRARLEKLLHAHAAPVSLFDKPVAEADTSAEDAPREGPGTRIGPYKLMELIGEGGMGLVFVAEQQRPVRRKVALKVIKPGMDTRQVVARFEAERQALALMDHPHIAKVLDAGATDSGRPYFVMELVKGVPITDYCDQHKVPIRQRLELFIHVCQAVQHAHQKGILHRDLKPSNILVMSQDGTPVVKVIDFGVAKAMGQQLTDKTIYTQFAQLVGTPLYMSPEQAGQSGLDVDTRSDIYSLGVLLFELLTGTTPFTKDRLREVGYDEMRRIIREEEPPKPSTRISTLGKAATTVSTQRQSSDPRQLSRLFRGELDWIVMKALEKDRNRRYETAIGLARDILHYLHDEPVVAGPPSSVYRLRKFVRRNRGTVLAAAAIVVLLVGGIIGTTLGLVRENNQRLQAEQARGKAEANFQHARTAVDDMYTQIAKKWLAGQPQMEPVQQEFLQKALRFYEQFAQEKSEDPAFRLETAQAYRRVAEIQHKLGEPVQAEDAYNLAIPLLQGLVDAFPDNTEYQRDLADSLHDLGLLVGDSGRYTEEEKAHRQALVIQKKLMDDHPAEAAYRRGFARGLFHLGCTMDWSRRYNEVPEFVEQAVKLQRQLVAEQPTSPEYRAELAESLNRLANYRTRFGPAGEDQKLLREAVPLLEKLTAEFPRDPTYRTLLAESHNYLAIALPSPEGEKALHRAIALEEKLVADFPSVNNYRYDLFRSHHQQALRLTKVHNLEATEKAYRQALAIGEPLAAVPKIDYFRNKLAQVHRELGDFLTTSKRFSEAEKEYRHTITLYEGLLVDYPKRSDFWVAIADMQEKLAHLVAQAARSPKEAEEARRQALEKRRAIWEKALASNPSDHVAYDKLAWLLATATDPKIRDVKRAVELAKNAVELAPKETNYWNTLGVAQNRAGDLKAAITALQKSIELNPKSVPPHHNLGIVLAREGKWPAMEAEFREAIRLRPNWPEAHYQLGRALWQQGRRDEAKAAYRQAIRGDSAQPEWLSQTVGLTLAKQGAVEEAIAAYAEAIRRKPDYALAHNNLAWLLATTSDPKFRDAKRAVELAKKGVELPPNEGTHWNTLGVAQYRAGDWKAAIATLEKSIELRKGGDSFDWFFLAMAHWQHGEKDKARQRYNEAVQWMEKSRSKDSELRRFQVEAANLLGIENGKK